MLAFGGLALGACLAMAAAVVIHAFRVVLVREWLAGSHGAPPFQRG